MGKQHPVVCQLVEMGCLYTVSTVRIKGFDAQIISEDEYNIGFIV